MTISTPTATSSGHRTSSLGREPPRHRRRPLVIGAVVVVVAGAAVGGFALRGGGPNTGAGNNTDPTSVTTVAQQSITSQTEVDATLGYTGSYSIVNGAQGTITWLPAIGQVVSQGQSLYDVNGTPVALLYGSTPAYRSLSEGATAGPDIEQLNADLVALRYVSEADLSPTSDEFSYGTKVGVDKLQAALGETQNGTLTLGQFAFEPSAVRVTALGSNTVLGSSAQPGSTILTGTSTARVVTIDLDADQEGEVAVGDDVSITLPNNQITPGKVTSVGTVATSSGDDSPGSSDTPTITVLVTPTNPSATGTLDQAPVDVSITTGTDKNALVVPIDALLALSGGGYGIEVAGGKGVHTIEPVSLGLFDDAAGTVAVSGPGVTAGQQIVIPASS